jgi:hypothetical protein
VPTYTLGTDGEFQLSAGYLPTTARIIMDSNLYAEVNLSLTSTTATMTAPTVVRVAYNVPIGTTTLSIAVNYPTSIDAAGSRPYGKLGENTTLGISTQTVEATSGGGDKTIAFTFSATASAGILIIDLVVPNSGTQLTTPVVFTPSIGTGQSATFSAGAGSSPSAGISRSGGASSPNKFLPW